MMILSDYFNYGIRMVKNDRQMANAEGNAGSRQSTMKQCKQTRLTSESPKGQRPKAIEMRRYFGTLDKPLSPGARAH